MSTALPNNTYAPIIHNGLGIITGNTVAHSLQRNNYLISATTINSKAKDTIYTKSGGDQFVVSTGGDILTQADTGNIILEAGGTTNTAISIIASNISGGVSIESGTGGINIDTTGNININSTGGGDLTIGGVNTGNINIISNISVNVNTDDFNVVSSNNIVLTSIDGEIILSSNVGEDTQRVILDNGGNLIIGASNIEFGYKTELAVSTQANSTPGRNGMIIYSSDTNISPEYRVNYTNPDGSQGVSTTLGVYSANSTAAIYNKYTAYQHGQLIIRVDGPAFTYNDVGRNLIFETSGNVSTITNIGTVILPAVLTSGSGAVNLTAGGYYLGSNDSEFVIQIDSEDDIGNGRDSDTFRWSIDGGANWIETFVPVKYALNIRYPLVVAGIATGVYVSFNSAVNNSIGDSWTVFAKVTAIVGENRYPGSNTTTNSGLSGNIFAGIYTNNNQPVIINGTAGSNVWSSLTSNIVLQSIDTLVSMAPYCGYVGTDTNNDLVIKTGGQERMRVTADGALCVGQEGSDARLQLASNFNKSLLVNDNVINLVNSSNSTGILGFQQNPVSTEINTGGYVIAYESQVQPSGTYNIYGNYFTANGDKLGESFKINREPTSGESVIYNQFQPHIAHSYDVQSDEYLVVWAGQVSVGDTAYRIRYRAFTNGFEPECDDTEISAPVGKNICLNPRVSSYDGGYIVVFNCAATNSPSAKYSMYFSRVYKSGGSFTSTTPQLIPTTDTSNNHVYPYVSGLSRFDIAAPGGFVVSYLAQTYENDPRYQIKYRAYYSNLQVASAEGSVTTTGVFNSQTDQDLSLSDGLPSCAPIPDNLAKLTGGFLIAYNTNYTAAVDYDALVASGINVNGISSQAFGRLNSVSTDPITNSKTLNISNVYLDFIQGEQLQIVSPDGYIIEKAGLVITPVGANSSVQHTANITLSTDPKDIKLVYYGTESMVGNSSAVGDEIFRRQINSGVLVVDAERAALPSSNTDIVPIQFTRINQPNFYAYRPLIPVKTNGLDECILGWESGSLPHIYSQRVSLPLGQLVGAEKLYAQDSLGQRQTDPYISTLVGTQGGVLGYSVAFGQTATDYSKTSVQQELTGSYSYLIHINNQTAEFVVSHDGQLGLGTTEPTGTLHIAALPSANPVDTQTASIILQTPSTNIDTINDKHQIRFADGNGTELARIKVKYSDYYQDLNPQADSLISYFKFDETPGTLAARNSSAYNIQSNVISDLSNINTGLINNQTQSGILIGFDTETCWTTGKINNGLLFNGFAANNYVKIQPASDVSAPYPDTIPSMGDGSFAVSTWLKTVGTSFDNLEMAILSIGSNSVGDVDNNRCGAFQLLLQNNGGANIYPVLRMKQSGSGVIDVFPTDSRINDQDWHHVVWDYYDSATSNMANIWIDGLLVSSDSISPRIDTSVATTNAGFKETYIGSNVGGNGLFYNGMLDELRLYKSHLLPSDISRLYTYGSEQRTSLLIQTLGTNSTYTDTAAGLVLDDTGSLLGAQFRNNSSRMLSGILYFQDAGETTVYGAGTQFLTEAAQGDNILLADGLGVGDITNNLYQVVAISNNTVMIIDRPPAVVSAPNTSFDNVTIYPGIFSARDENSDLKMTMNQFGDLVVGSRRSTTNPTRVEIRGSGTDENKNGLTLHNTNTSSESSVAAGDRANKIYFKTANSVSQADVLQGLFKTSLSGEGRFASQMEFFVNDNPSTDVVSDSGLTRVLALSNNSMFVGDSAPIAAGITKGVLNIQSYDSDPLTLTFINQQPAASKVFGNNTDLLFYSEAAAAAEDNELIKIKASHDYPTPTTGSKACGRIDFFVSTEEPLHTGTFVDKDNIADPQNLSRLCITSNGFVGVHSQRPHGIFQVSPRYIDNQYKVFTANINSQFGSGNINVADDISTGVNGYLLRGGSFVVYDGANLTSLVLSNITDPIITGGSGVPVGTSNIQLADLSAPISALTNRPYSLHYPGMIVNKYGLVGIGNSGFGDDNTAYHLDISGNTAVKGVFSLGANISSSVSPSTAPGFRASLDGSNLEIQATSGGGFTPISDYITNTTTRTIRRTTLDDISLTTDYTILADIGAGGITLPNPLNNSNIGKILVVKNINSVGMPINSPVSIDGAAPAITLTQWQSRTFQVAYLSSTYQYVIIGSS